MAAEASASTRRRRSTECTTSAYPATEAALLVWSAPTKCQCSLGSATSAALAEASWSRLSPTSVTPRSASAPTSEAGQVLVTATRVTSPGARPAAAAAAAIRACTSARFAASSAWRVADAGSATRRVQPDDAREASGRAVAAVGVLLGVVVGAPAERRPPRRHRASRSCPSTPARRSRLGVPARVRPPPSRTPGRRRRPRLHVGRDLVAAGARWPGRSSACVRSGSAPRSSMALHGRGDDPELHALAPGVRDRRRRRPRRRRAAPVRSPRPSRPAPGPGRA